VLDQSMEPIAAEDEDVSGLDGQRLADVDLELLHYADRALQNISPRMRLGLLRSQKAFPDHRGDQGMVLGQLLDLIVADQIDAGVPDVSEDRVVVADDQRRQWR